MIEKPNILETSEPTIGGLPSSEIPRTTPFFYVLVVLVIVGFASFFFYARLTTPKDTSILNPSVDDLHRLNLEGKLEPERGYIYNGFSFVFFDGLWYTKIKRGDTAYNVPLHFGPRSLNVTKKGSLNQTFDKGDLHIVIDPLGPNSDFVALAAGELAQNIATVIDRIPVGACDKNETSMCQDRPIITCATTTVATVYLLQEPGPELELNGMCIIARGLRYDLVRAVDYLLLDWYNVVE